MHHNADTEMERNADEAWRGCLFCRTGKEHSIIQEMRQYVPELRAIAPEKLRNRRQNRREIEEWVPLIPGYIFFESDKPELPAKLTQMQNALRLLRYPDGDWQLRGYDDQFARLLFENDGRLGFSKAVFDEGNRIQILDGIMKDYQGMITRVNRRARTAEVTIMFQGKKISIWLGYELMERTDNK